MAGLIPATGGFVPQGEALQVACELVTASRNPAAPGYAEASQRLEQQMVDPGFMVHLCYVFARLTPQHLADDVRQLAGLVLKEGIRRAPLLSLDVQTQGFVRQELLVALVDPHSPAVRKTAGSVITSMCAVWGPAVAGGLRGWPELMPALYGMLDQALTQQQQQQQQHQHQPEAAAAAAAAVVVSAGGALSCVAKICEDLGALLELSVVTQLVPRLLRFFAFPDEGPRLSAVEALMHLGCWAEHDEVAARVLGPEPLNNYLAGLSSLTGDPSPRVRRAVCESLVELLQRAPGRLAPAAPSVVEFMLAASAGGGGGEGALEVAFAAMDFWIPCCESPLFAPGADFEHVLRGCLPTLVPLLMQRMVYSREEIDDFDD